MRKFIDIVSSLNNTTSLNHSFLIEAKDYQQMLESCKGIIAQYENYYSNPENNSFAVSSLNKTPEWKQLIKNIEEFARALRKDRSVWVTRFMRLYLARSLIFPMENIHGHEEMIKISANAKKLFLRYFVEYDKQTSFSSKNQIDQVLSSSIDSYVSVTGIENVFFSLKNSIQHYLGIPYSKIQNYEFLMTKTRNDIYEELSALEEEFKERAKGKLVLEAGDEIILRLPNNYVWVKLNRASCPKEAAAMGHCGNSPRSGSQERILSLRQIEDEVDNVQYMRPCLTFILLPNGTLGEMKGRGNDKPATHYHDQIEALLRLPIIKGITGGGYLSSNNFSLSDMDGEQKKNIINDKPELLPLKDWYNDYGITDKFEMMLLKSYDSNTEIAFQQLLSDTMLKVDDKEQLTTKYPQIMWLSELYTATGGYSELVKDKLKRIYERDGYKVLRQQISASYFDINDMKKMSEDFPEFLTPLEYYKAQGMNENLINQIVVGVQQHQTEKPYFLQHGYSYSNHGRKHPQRWWFDNKDYYTEGFFPEMMEEADRKLLFTKHPELLLPRERYKFEGKLTDEFSAIIAQNVREKGVKWFTSQHVQWEKFDENDQHKLFESYPDIAPCAYLLKKHGPTSDQLLNSIDKMVFSDDNENEWPDGSISNHEVEIGGKKYFERFKWDSVEDFIDNMGDNEFQRFSSDDEYSQIGDMWPNNDDYNVENFDDIIGKQKVGVVSEHIQSLLAEENLEEELEELQDSPHHWSTILRFIIDHDDELLDHIKRSVSQGAESGASSELYNAKISALQNASVDIGFLDFSMGKTHDNKDFIAFDEPVRLLLTPENLAEFFDQYYEIEDGSYSELETFIPDKIKIDLPYYGWSDFDSATAAEYFYENADLPFEQNPYKNTEKMAIPEMMTALQAVYSKLGKTVPTIDDMNNENKVRDKLKYAIKEYYGK